MITPVTSSLATPGPLSGPQLTVSREQTVPTKVVLPLIKESVLYLHSYNNAVVSCSETCAVLKTKISSLKA